MPKPHLLYADLPPWSVSLRRPACLPACFAQAEASVDREFTARGIGVCLIPASAIADPCSTAFGWRNLSKVASHWAVEAGAWTCRHLAHLQRVIQVRFPAFAVRDSSPGVTGLEDKPRSQPPCFKLLVDSRAPVSSCLALAAPRQ